MLTHDQHASVSLVSGSSHVLVYMFPETSHEIFSGSSCALWYIFPRQQHEIFPGTSHALFRTLMRLHAVILSKSSCSHSTYNSCTRLQASERSPCSYSDPGLAYFPWRRAWCRNTTIVTFLTLRHDLLFFHVGEPGAGTPPWLHFSP